MLIFSSGNQKYAACLRNNVPIETLHSDHSATDFSQVGLNDFLSYDKLFCHEGHTKSTDGIFEIQFFSNWIGSEVSFKYPAEANGEPAVKKATKRMLHKINNSKSVFLQNLTFYHRLHTF